MNYSKIRDGIIDSLTKKMLRTSLWGVLDITFMKRRYEIAIIADELADQEYFKEHGFTIRLIDDFNFIQKIPYFKDNKEFIEKHNLYFLGKESYQEYLLHMYKERIKNEKSI